MKINIANGIFLFPIIPFIFPNFSIDSSFLSNTIVFISIFFGFTSSSFAMIIFSNYAKSAYAKKSDQQNMFYKISDIYKKIFTIQISIIVFSLCYTTFLNFFQSFSTASLSFCDSLTIISFVSIFVNTFFVFLFMLPECKSSGRCRRLRRRLQF